MPAYDFTTANQNLGNAFDATRDAVSARSRDTAAARVRGRLANENRGQITAIQNAGSRNMGLINARMAAQGRASQNALASGLADVEQNYAQNQLAAGQAMGNIAAAQGNLQRDIGQLGVSEKNAGTEAEDVANRLRLGLEQGEIQREQLAEQNRAAKKKELLDWYNSFATSGATVSESSAFNNRFNDLITNMFGANGLTAAAADPTPTVSGTASSGLDSSFLMAAYNNDSTLESRTARSLGLEPQAGESYEDWSRRISSSPASVRLGMRAG